MYAGALSASDKVDGTPFYFETQTHNLIFLNDFSVAETKPLESVETIIQANARDLTISNPGFWDDIPERNDPMRQKLTWFLWRNRRKITGLYKQLVLYNV